MLDKRFVVQNAEQVQTNCDARGVKVDVARFCELENQRRALLADVESLNRQANEISKSIGQAPDDAQREQRKRQGREIRERRDSLKVELEQITAEANAIHRHIPNLSHPDAPRGSAADNRLVRHGATDVAHRSFNPIDHVELAEKHRLIDFEGGARVAGHGYYFLQNEAVLLEIALQQYALDKLISAGFTPVVTPDVARSDILKGIGYIPRGPETQIYSIENSDLNLVATAEITLGGLYAGQTLDSEQLPVKLCGISHCFRTEAGAAGRATRGLYRVHQFTKVEMFAFTDAQQSDAMLDHLCQLQCELFDNLGIPYRVVDTATGDLGGPAYRKFDLEAWMPGRGESGEYGEVTSASNCTDYQARRLDIRCKTRGQKGTRFVHTLNGTAVAVSRALIAILENYQQADGSILIPEALRPWVGKHRIGGSDR